jgi:polygalacturonase
MATPASDASRAKDWQAHLDAFKWRRAIQDAGGRNLMNHPLIVAALCLVCLTACAARASDALTTTQSTRFSIADFGAIGDGAALNTLAIQKTIDHAAALGGGTVVIPAGVFRSGAVFLKVGVNLELERGAVLKGSTDIGDYPLTKTRIEGHFQQWVPALVNADGVDHLRISGEGTLDGSGKPFWDEFWRRIGADPNTKNLDVPRPRLLFIENASDVQISGIRLKDSGFWNLHLYRCRDSLISGLDISAPAKSPSTDGTDIDSSQNITIQNCHISVDDDCICLKGSKGPFALDDKESPPVEHIRVRGCTFGEGDSVLTVGSEATIVRDVVVESCTVTSAATKRMNVVRLKLRPDTPQMYSDIHFRDITVAGEGQLISIEPWKQYFDLQGQPAPARSVSNLTITNIKGTCGSFGTIEGNKGDLIENIVLENIDLELKHPKPRIEKVSNLIVRNVKINGADYAGPQP